MKMAMIELVGQLQKKCCLSRSIRRCFWVFQQSQKRIGKPIVRSYNSSTHHRNNCLDTPLVRCFNCSPRWGDSKCSICDSKNSTFQKIDQHLNDRQKRIGVKMLEVKEAFKGGMSAKKCMKSAKTSKPTATWDIRKLVEMCTSKLWRWKKYFVSNKIRKLQIR